MSNDNKFFREETCKTPLRIVNIVILTSQHTHDATDRTSRAFFTPSNQNLSSRRATRTQKPFLAVQPRTFQALVVP